MMKKIIQIFMAIMFAIPLMSQPIVSLEDVVSGPGPVTVNLDLIGLNNVGAVTIRIDYDGDVLTYSGPLEVAFNGSNIAINPNYGGSSVLALVWTSVSGVNINGTFLELEFDYLGGFTTDLEFLTDFCEITTPNGTSLVVPGDYVDGSVSPDLSPVGTLTISEVFTTGADSIPLPDPPGGYLVIPDPVDVPVVADGLSAAAVGSIELSISFNNQKLTYTGYTANQFSGWVVSVDQLAGTLTFIKTSASALSILDGDLITIHFDFLTGLAEVNFTPETSLHYINATPVPVGLVDGFVNSVTEVNLKVFLEGLYIGGGLMRKAQDHDGVSPFDKYSGTVADLITVELHDASNYGTIVWSQSDIELNTDGTALALVPSMFSDQYYITIKSRNHLETVSATAVLFGGSITYDFTDALSKAYGNNQKDLLDGNFAIFAGDVNQDGFINVADRSLVQSALLALEKGYLIEDTNADGTVNVLDRTLVQTGLLNFVIRVTP
ncbi:MAG: hypothetical protein IH598_16475 [Bacteroidales bacterium]|nr:hypothetical protein [Bacteroidales bacterium]